MHTDSSDQAQTINSQRDWQQRRTDLLASLQQVMGPMPDESRRCPLDMQVLETCETEHYTRLKITYQAEPGDQVPAYLFLPKCHAGPTPAMLCLHQTTALGKGEPAGIGGVPNLHYARELAERGYVTLAPDYPNFGDYQVDAYAMGYASGTMKGIWNHRRALDLLQSLPQVAAERIGCLGHSLGGHNTLFLAAFDERVKVAVTSCGFTAFAKYYGGDLTGWSHAGYMPRIKELYHANPSEMPFDFSDVLRAIAPRPVFINAPLSDSNFEWIGVDDCVAAAKPVYGLYGVRRHLICRHPDSQHDFPPQVREEAYAYVDSILKR
ncbi:MAG: alpha/beta hydrolase [Armatimonadota bacterium]